MAVATQPQSRGYRIFHGAMVLVVVAVAGIIAAAAGMGINARIHPEQVGSSVRRVSDGSKVGGASSTLTRNDDGFDFTFDSSQLPAGHIVTLRAEIFNQPEHCTHGAKRGTCGADDLTEASVEGSVVFLRAAWLRGASEVHFEGTLSSGDQDHAVTGGGLANPGAAYVRFVLMDHGAPVAGEFAPMLNTLGAGCANPPFGSGTPGSIDCADIQESTHEP